MRKELRFGDFPLLPQSSKSNPAQPREEVTMGASCIAVWMISAAHQVSSAPKISKAGQAPTAPSGGDKRPFQYKSSGYEVNGIFPAIKVECAIFECIM